MTSTLLNITDSSSKLIFSDKIGTSFVFCDMNLLFCLFEWYSQDIWHTELAIFEKYSIKKKSYCCLMYILEILEK